MNPLGNEGDVTDVGLIPGLGRSTGGNGTWEIPRTEVWQATVYFSSVQSLSHVRFLATPWTSTPGLPVRYQLPEFTQTHVHRVGDAIQPSHPLLSPSPPAFNHAQ